jgi:hypothetical protein
VFRDPTATPPDPLNNVNRLVPFVTIHLGEEAIQAVLKDAIGPGGLGIAIGPYMGHVADLPSTDFVITADGQTKTVSVTGMSADMQDPQNAAIVTALAGLAERLDHFGDAVSGEELFVPAAYRGVLNHADQAFGPVIPWPWATVKPTDFKGENDFLLKRTMTPAEVDALGIPGISVASPGSPSRRPTASSTRSPSGLCSRTRPSRAPQPAHSGVGGSAPSLTHRSALARVLAAALDWARLRRPTFRCESGDQTPAPSYL